MLELLKFAEENGVLKVITLLKCLNLYILYYCVQMLHDWPDLQLVSLIHVVQVGKNSARKRNKAYNYMA